jgi:hypothetical protein
MVMDGFGYEDEGARSRWLKIGGGVLAGVVLLAAGFGIGRLSAPAAGGGQQARVSGQSGPGPWRVENGVPVGYAHTPEGAVAAATNYLTVIDGPMLTQPERYRAAIDGLAAPDSKSKLRSTGERQLATFQTTMGMADYVQQGRQVILRAIPLTYHIDGYDGTAARVSIWAEALLAVDGVLSPRVNWATSTYALEWVAGDWKLTDTGGSQSGTDGPVPLVTQQSTQTSGLPPQLKDYKGYGRDVGP